MVEMYSSCKIWCFNTQKTKDNEKIIFDIFIYNVIMKNKEQFYFLVQIISFFTIHQKHICDEKFSFFYHKSLFAEIYNFF